MPIFPGVSGMRAATAKFPRGAKYKPPTHRNKLDLIEEKWPAPPKEPVLSEMSVLKRNRSLVVLYSTNSLN